MLKLTFRRDLQQLRAGQSFELRARQLHYLWQYSRDARLQGCASMEHYVCIRKRHQPNPRAKRTEGAFCETAAILRPELQSKRRMDCKLGFGTSRTGLSFPLRHLEHLFLPSSEIHFDCTNPHPNVSEFVGGEVKENKNIAKHFPTGKSSQSAICRPSCTTFHVAKWASGGEGDGLRK